MQKVRGHSEELPLFVGTGFQDLFHPPRRGAFHLSLTVLVHYRSPANTQPWMMVHPDSHRVSRAPWYSGTCPQSPMDFAYGGLTLYARPSQTSRLSIGLVTLRHSCRSGQQALQPHTNNACRLTLAWFGLFPFRSPLLGESRLISFPPGT